MNRRDFIVGTAALVAVPSCINMNLLNVNPLGLAGGGQIVQVTIVDPGVGQNLEWDVPPDWSFEFLFARFVLTTSATPGNRSVLLGTTLKTLNTYTAEDTNTIADSTQQACQFESGWGSVMGSAVLHRVPVGRLWMPPNTHMLVTATAMAVDDQLSSFVMTGIVHPLK